MQSSTTSERSWSAFEQARACWPGVTITFEQLAAHLERLGWGDVLPPQLAAVYLCAACAQGVEAAHQALERAYLSPLERTLSCRHTNWDLVGEILQQTRERLLVGPTPRIATYRGDGPLPAWLRVVADRIAKDLFRRDDGRRRALAELLHPCTLSEAVPSQEHAPCGHALDQGWLSSVQSCVSRAIAALCDGDRRLLFLHYVQGVAADQIGDALGVDRSTVYRRLRRAEHKLRHKVLWDLQLSVGGVPADELNLLLWASSDQIRLETSAWDTA